MSADLFEPEGSILKKLLLTLAYFGLIGSSVSFTPSLAKANVVSLMTVSAHDHHTCAINAEGFVHCWGTNTTGAATVPIDLGRVKQVSVGGDSFFDHSCAITVSGVLRCWGSNDSGQLQVPQYLGKVNQVDAGGKHTCAIFEDSILRCWGRNNRGQVDIPQNLGMVTSVSSGQWNTCAITVSKSLKCWGSNDQGQLNIPADLGDVSQVSVGSEHVCALKTSGQLRCWGYWFASGPATLTTTAKQYIQVSSGPWNVCAVDTNQLVQCWGYNSASLNGAWDEKGGPVKEVSSGLEHACAVKTNGQLVCYGENNRSQLQIPANFGNGNVGTQEIEAVNLPGTNSYYFINLNRTDWATAKNQAESAVFRGVSGHLANITSKTENDFVAALLGTKTSNWDRDHAWFGARSSEWPQFKFVAGPEANQSLTYTSWYPGEPNRFAGSNEDFAVIRPDGTWNDYCCGGLWSVIEFQLPERIEVTDAINLPGTDSYYHLSLTKQTWEQARAQALSMSFHGVTGHLANITSKTENEFLAELLSRKTSNSENGNAWFGLKATTWPNFGFTDGVEKGGNLTFTNWGEGEPNGGSWNEIYAVLRPDGRWNDFRCCEGLWSIVEFRLPTKTLTTATHVIDPLTGSAYMPVNLAMSWEDAKQFAESQSLGNLRGHLATIDTEAESSFLESTLQGSNYWLGYRNFFRGVGQRQLWISDGGAQAGKVLADCDQYQPCDSKISFIQGAEFLQLKDSKLVAEVGSAKAKFVVEYSVQVPKKPYFVEVVTGMAHTCALTTLGQVFCWGNGSLGQLGISGNKLTDANFNTLKKVNKPVLIEALSNVVHLAAGTNHTCAVTSDGKIHCWGQNSSGQLGDGTKVSSSRPVEVKSILNASSLALGAYHSCALTLDGQVYCWGSDNIGYGTSGVGQLGNGLPIQDSVIPSKVVGLTEKVTQIASGESHSCALLENKKLMCWGKGNWGELGSGIFGNSPIPILVAQHNSYQVWQVAASFENTCSLLGGPDKGQVWCWGFKTWGTLGNNSGLESSYVGTAIPIKSNIENATHISTGGGTACAVVAQKPYCWGSGLFRQTQQRFYSGGWFNERINNPSEIKLPSGVDHISVSKGIEFESTSSGVVCAWSWQNIYCWGNENSSGQSGYGEFIEGPQPTKVEFSLTSLPEEPQTPAQPMSLEAVSLDATSVILSWIDPDKNSSPRKNDYIIWLKSQNGSVQQSIHGTADEGTVLRIVGLRPGEEYEITLKSLFQDMASESLIGNVKTLSAAPSAPRDLKSETPTDTSVSLVWGAPIENGGSSILNYKVEYQPIGALDWSSIMAPAEASGSFLVSNLRSSTSYRFRVSAINLAGISEASNFAYVSTLNRVKPVAPASVSVAAVRLNGAQLSWSRVHSSAKVTNYLVDVSLDGVAWSPVHKRASAATNLTINGLKPGTSYVIRVAAVNTHGVGEYAATTVNTLATAPSAPRELKIQAIISSGMSLSWAKPDSDGGSVIADYVIELHGGGKSWSVLEKTVSDKTGFQISNLKPGLRYSVRVKAVNSRGVSKSSNTLSALTLQSAPIAPSNLSIKSIEPSRISVNWTTPANGGSRVIESKVEASFDNGQTWKTEWTSLSSSATATLTQIAKKGSCLIRVSLRNALGWSSPSHTVFLTIP